MLRDDYILKLNDPKKKKRLAYAAKLGKLMKKEGKRKAHRACCGFIHSAYSFSPYTPSMAAYMAYNNGLTCAGMVDTGTLAGGSDAVIDKSCGSGLQAAFAQSVVQQRFVAVAVNVDEAGCQRKAGSVHRFPGGF